MITFLEQMEGLQQSFWITALVASFIFVIQTILTFVGSDSSDGLNADFDGNLDGVDAPFQLFSFRNLINFILGFSWTGVAFYTSLQNKFLLIILAVIVGIAFVAAFFLIIRQILKLTEDNTFYIESIIGRNGVVYLTIPENKSGVGKIQISIKGTQHEITATTKDTNKILTGTPVKVLEVEDQMAVVSVQY